MRSGVPAGFDADSLTIFQAVELFFDSGTVRLWNGIGDLTISGNTYAGAGSLLGISRIEENAEISAKSVTVQLSGVSTTILSYALNENYQYRRANIHVGTIADGVATPYQAFSGRMDVMKIVEAGETATIPLTIENQLIDLDRPRVRRWTAEDQKALYPSDKCFDALNSLQEAEILWGG